MNKIQRYKTLSVVAFAITVFALVVTVGRVSYARIYNPSSGGITSLGGLTGATQTFANDTNVTISSSGTTHTLGWTGTLAVSRGGTGVGSFSGNSIIVSNSAGTSLTATGSQLTVGSVLSTTTSASTFAGAVNPATNDAAALGSATLSWSDLFLASGGLINWANGDAVLTHATGLLNLSTGKFGIASSSPAGALGVQGNAFISGYLTYASSTATGTVTTAGLTATGNIDLRSGTLIARQYPSFSYATTSWSGTTTIFLGPAFVAETWNGVKCETNTGTVMVSFTDGTNRTETLNASSTVGNFTLATNNTFTASESRRVDIGTPASSPLKVACTVDKTINQ